MVPYAIILELKSFMYLNVVVSVLLRIQISFLTDPKGGSSQLDWFFFTNFNMYFKMSLE